jgi:hypothetical protein
MLFKVSWDDDPKSMIRCQAEGRWTWDDYHRALDQVVTMRLGWEVHP